MTMPEKGSQIIQSFYMTTLSRAEREDVDTSKYILNQCNIGILELLFPDVVPNTFKSDNGLIKMLDIMDFTEMLQFDEWKPLIPSIFDLESDLWKHQAGESEPFVGFGHLKDQRRLCILSKATEECVPYTIPPSQQDTSASKKPECWSYHLQNHCKKVMDANRKCKRSEHLVAALSGCESLLFERLTAEDFKNGFDETIEGHDKLGMQYPHTIHPPLKPCPPYKEKKWKDPPVFSWKVASQRKMSQGDWLLTPEEQNWKGLYVMHTESGYSFRLHCRLNEYFLEIVYRIFPQAPKQGETNAPFLIFKLIAQGSQWQYFHGDHLGLSWELAIRLIEETGYTPYIFLVTLRRGELEGVEFMDKAAKYKIWKLHRNDEEFEFQVPAGHGYAGPSAWPHSGGVYKTRPLEQSSLPTDIVRLLVFVEHPGFCRVSDTVQMYYETKETISESTPQVGTSFTTPSSPPAATASSQVDGIADFPSDKVPKKKKPKTELPAVSMTLKYPDHSMFQLSTAEADYYGKLAHKELGKPPNEMRRKILYELCAKYLKKVIGNSDAAKRLLEVERGLRYTKEIYLLNNTRRLTKESCAKKERCSSASTESFWNCKSVFFWALHHSPPITVTNFPASEWSHFTTEKVAELWPGVTADILVSDITQQEFSDQFT